MLTKTKPLLKVVVTAIMTVFSIDTNRNDIPKSAKKVRARVSGLHLSSVNEIKVLNIVKVVQTGWATDAKVLLICSLHFQFKYKFAVNMF